MCCGRGKSTFRFTNTAIPAATAADNRGATSQVAPTFEYVGRTALTVFGPVSGAPYRFNGPGARVRVDARDRQSLSGVPVLRLVP